MEDFRSRGTRMTEADSFERLMYGLRTAEESARQLAHHRGDLRWIKVAKLLHQNQVGVSRLIAASILRPGAA